jgi:hypothetical protein
MTQRYAHLSPTYKIKAIDRMNTLWACTESRPSTPQMLPEPAPVTPPSQIAYQQPPPAAQAP